jgi:hypothetical protein
MINCPALYIQIILIFRTKAVGLQERLPYSGICIRLSSSVADPGCLSRISDPNFSITDPGSRVKKIPGSASKNLSILTQKMVYKLGNIIRDVHPGSGTQIDPDLYILPIPDPGVKKAPDPDP